MNDELRLAMTPSLSELQRLRLSDAEYVILTDATNEASHEPSSAHDIKLSEAEIQSNSHRLAPIDGQTTPDRLIPRQTQGNRNIEEALFSSNDSEIERAALQAEAFDSDNSEMQRVAVAAEYEENKAEQENRVRKPQRIESGDTRDARAENQTFRAERDDQAEQSRAKAVDSAEAPRVDPSDSLAQAKSDLMRSDEALELINQDEPMETDEAEQRKLHRQKEAQLLEYLGDMKFDEEHHIIATLQSPEENLLTGTIEPSIGLNRFIPTNDGGVEILRNFEYLPVDNLSEIGASFHSLVKEDETGEISPHGEMETWVLHRTLRDRQNDILEDGTICEQGRNSNRTDEKERESVDVIPATPTSSNEFDIKLEEEQHNQRQKEQSNDELLQNLSVPESAWDVHKENNQETEEEVNAMVSQRPSIEQYANYADSGLRLTQYIPELFIDSDEEIQSESDEDIPEEDANGESDEEILGTEGANVMVVTRNSAKRRRDEIMENLEEETSRSEEPEDEWKKMKQAQLRDGDIRSFTKLTIEGRKPLEYEVRAESPLANNLYAIFDSLLVINGHLYKKTLDDSNDIRNLLIIPDSQSPGLIRRTHEKLCHMDFWRIEKQISSRYYIFNLKEISKIVKTQCEKCLLSRKPATPPHRLIKTFSSSPGWAASCDLVQLPQVGPFRYILTCIDLATGYLFARKQASKSAEETAKSFQNIQWANGVTFRVVVIDPGKEFVNHQFQLVCDTNSTQIIINHVLDKNACGAVESAHHRLLTLLRRTLENDSDWPKQYKKATFALNACLFKYGRNPGCITSPLSLFNGRSVEGVAWAENEMERNLVEKNASVRQLMNSIAKERLIYVPMLSANVLNRKTFYVAQKILLWREFCLKKRTLHTGEVRMKLNRYWSIGEIVNVVTQDIYEVKLLQTGESRRVHRRQIRELPVDFDPTLMEKQGASSHKTQKQNKCKKGPLVPPDL